MGVGGTGSERDVWQIGGVGLVGRGRVWLLLAGGRGLGTPRGQDGGNAKKREWSVLPARAQLKMYACG